MRTFITVACETARNHQISALHWFMPKILKVESKEESWEY